MKRSIVWWLSLMLAIAGISCPVSAHALSLSEALATALKNSLDIQMQKERVHVRAFEVEEKEAAFDPEIHFKGGLSRAAAASQEIASGLTFGNPSTTRQLSAGLSRALGYGGKSTLRLLQRWGGPPLSSGDFVRTDLRLEVEQPLLRGWGREITETPIQRARAYRAIEQITLDLQAVETIVHVVEAYWEAVFARDNLAIAEQRHRLALQLVEINRARVSLGVSAPVETLTAESSAAAREEAVVVAQANIQNAEDRLRKLLRLPGESDSVVTPTDQPPPPAVLEEEEQKLIEAALLHRPEIARQTLDLHQQTLLVRLAEDKLRPSLDLTAGFAPLGIGSSHRESLSRLPQGDPYTWDVGMAFSYPIGNQAATAQYQASLAEHDRMRLAKENLRQQIIYEVRERMREVKTSEKRIESNGRARTLAEQKLAAGDERFRLGLIPSQDLLKMQEEVAEVKSSALRALIDYHKAKARLDQVTGAWVMRYRSIS